MTYKTGAWGEKAKARSKKRLKYFRQYWHKNYGDKCRDKYKPNTRTEYKGLGWQGEIEALTILSGAIRQPRYIGYDLLWNGKRIDVKTTKIRKNRNDWTFKTRTQIHRVDFFLCILKDREGKTIDSLLIPDSLIKSKWVFYLHTRNLPKYKQYSTMKKESG